MVLLVIGDGLPYDDGYEDRYARADARQAIQEAVLRGIGVAGIGIRSSTEPDVLEDVWSDASFRVIGQCDDIQRHLRGLLLNAYAFGKMATIAGLAAIAAFIAAGALLILSALGLYHSRKVEPTVEIFAAATPTVTNGAPADKLLKV